MVKVALMHLKSHFDSFILIFSLFLQINEDKNYLSMKTPIKVTIDEIHSRVNGCLNRLSFIHIP